MKWINADNFGENLIKPPTASGFGGAFEYNSRVPAKTLKWLSTRKGARFNFESRLLRIKAKISTIKITRKSVQ